MTINKLKMTKNTKKITERIFFKQTIHKTNLKAINIVTIVLSIIMLTLGFVLIIDTNFKFESIHRIDDGCFDDKCEYLMRIDKERLKGPLFIYIEYKSFYVDHRKVMLSINYKQMRGEEVDRDDLKNDCKDYLTYKDLSNFYPDLAKDKDPDALLFPCGLFSFLYNRRKVIR